MNGAAELPDELLFERLAAGDEEAFRALYRRHHGPLYRFALHMTGRAEAAEEVVQETFMVLIRGGGKFDPGRGELAGFLFGIARNHVHRFLDADGRYQGLPEEGPEALAGHGPAPLPEVAEPTARLIQSETVEQVRRAVLSLPERYREVVTLCDLEEMEYERAASILNCPVGTVRSRLNRAREMLAEKLRVTLAPSSAPRVRFHGRVGHEVME
jgi:RNA polymerase sigma-70 factor (ECF subfamily)